MTGRHRTIVAALALLAILSVLLLVVYAGNACPAQTPNNPCPQAGFNRIVVVGLAALAVTLTVTPFAFLGEFVVRRRIAYRGEQVFRWLHGRGAEAVDRAGRDLCRPAGRPRRVVCCAPV